MEIKYNDVVVTRVKDPMANLDTLWKASLLFGFNRPAWGGLMQHVLTGDLKGKSSVVFLPMINMSSSDATCIYLTFKFISVHAQRHAISATSVTIDLHVGSTRLPIE